MFKNIIPFVLLSTLFSCKKDDNAQTCDKTMASVAGAYSLSKMELGMGGVFSDVTSLLETRELDDKIVLNSNGTSVYKDMGAVCSPLENSTGTWNISPAGKLTVNNDGGPGDISEADPSNPLIQFRLTLKR